MSRARCFLDLSQKRSHGVPYRVEVPTAEYCRRQIKCQAACPVHTDARGYVRAIAEGDVERAYLIARGPNPLASICGRVCGAPCEAACRRSDYDQAIAIRSLKRSVCEQFGPEKCPDGGKGQLDYLKSLFQRFAPHACRGREELTWAPAAAVESLARHFAKQPGTTLFALGMGPNQFFNNDNKDRDVFLLAALTGNVGRIGGNVGSYAGNYRVALFNGCPQYTNENPFDLELDPTKAKEGVPAIMNSRTTPKAVGYEQGNDSRPWYTKSGRLDLDPGQSPSRQPDRLLSPHQEDGAPSFPAIRAGA